MPPKSVMSLIARFVRPRSICSFDFRNDPVRVAGVHGLRGAVRDQVQLFQHDGADQGRFAIGLDDGGKNAGSAGRLPATRRRRSPAGPCDCRRTHGGRARRLQVQLVRHALGQHELGRAGVDNATHARPPTALSCAAPGRRARRRYSWQLRTPRRSGQLLSPRWFSCVYPPDVGRRNMRHA